MFSQAVVRYDRMPRPSCVKSELAVLTCQQTEAQIASQRDFLGTHQTFGGANALGGHLWRSELVERRRSLVLCTIWRACFSKLLRRASASSRRASRNLQTTELFTSGSLCAVDKQMCHRGAPAHVAHKAAACYMAAESSEKTEIIRPCSVAHISQRRRYAG